MRRSARLYQLGHTKLQIAQKHGNIIIGVFVSIAARAGAEQDHSLKRPAIRFRQGLAETSEDGVYGNFRRPWRPLTRSWPRACSDQNSQ